MSPPDIRCKACDHPRSPDAGYGMLRTTLRALAESATRGCVPCSIFANSIRQFLDDNRDVVPEVSSDLQLRIDFNMFGTRRSLEICFLGTALKLSFFCSSYTPWLMRTVPHLSLGNEIPESTASDASLEWLRQQVQTCRSSHVSCSAASRPSLPSRLIDVGTEPASGSGAVRLHEPKDENAPYVCLSHCWGRKPFLRTLTTNIDSHKHEIPWEELPLTFRQIVILTRKLGLRYVWIDSLCIIQDDQDDWRREAANLAAIFQNSYLVITAAKSAGPEGGLFASVPAEFKTYTIETAGDDNTTERIQCRQSLQHIQSHTGRLLGTSLALPTLKRGWIFQERFLSPRVVHFGPEEMSWECLEDMTCQCAGQRDISESYAAAGAPRWLEQMLERTSRPKSYYNMAAWQKLEKAELENCWHRLVEDYTRLDLTFEKDIFPAVSGLAKQFQSIRKSRYFAGLWEDSIRKDLLWHVEPKDSEDEPGSCRAWAHRPENWRAPSWSWASVKSAVQFIDPTEGMVHSCEVIDTSCSLAGPDLTGELTAGHVTLRGRLIPTTVRYNDKVPRAELKPWNLLKLGLLQGRMGNVWADWNCSTAGPHHVSPGSTAWCFLVSQTLPTSALCCLILKAAELDQDMSESGIFERIGLLELFAGQTSEGGASWRQQVLDLGEVVTVKIR